MHRERPKTKAFDHKEMTAATSKLQTLNYTIQFARTRAIWAVEQMAHSDDGGHGTSP